jgi:hypothetical protein
MVKIGALNFKVSTAPGVPSLFFITTTFISVGSIFETPLLSSSYFSPSANVWVVACLTRAQGIKSRPPAKSHNVKERRRLTGKGIR